MCTTTLKRSSPTRRVPVTVVENVYLAADALVPAPDRVAPDVRLALVDRAAVPGEAGGQRGEVLFVGGLQVAGDDLRCSAHTSLL